MLCVNHLFHRFHRTLWIASIFAVLLGMNASSTYAQIDLHAHLHMKPGLGFFLQGSFTAPPAANQWSDKVFTRVSSTSLAEMTSNTRPKLIVLSLYAHPYLSYSFSRDGFHFDRRENVRRTLDQEYLEFKQFVDSHSDRFVIAKNSKEARAILKENKTVIVISIEGAFGVLESPEDYRKWIEERGLAIVTPVHLTPDHLGGNALMSTLVSIANSTGDFFSAVMETRGACLRNFCKSPSGFSADGNQLIDELMKQKVWIDLAHSNEKEVNAVIGKYSPSALPLLITHTQLRDFFPVERGLGQNEINYIREYDGIIGLIPSQYMMPGAMKEAGNEALKAHPEEVNMPSAASGISCISGLDVFRKTIAYTIARIGAPHRVALASDINAPLDGLSPGCGEPVANLTHTQTLDDALFDLHRRGYYTYSQWNVLTRFVSPDLPNESWADETLEHFLKMWEKVRP